MDPEIKELWLDALRSGEFKQSKGLLWGDIRDRHDDPTGELGYCCLGVLCKVMGWDLHDADGRIFTGIASGPPELVGPNASAGDIISATDATDDYLVGTVSGLTHNNRSYLASLNDNGMTFAEIADVIEREL